MDDGDRVAVALDHPRRRARRQASPRCRWLINAMRLPIEPLGVHSASSMPSIPATRVSSSRIVGSRPRTSSSTSALAIASRICFVGRVTVSERRSIGPSEDDRRERAGRIRAIQPRGYASVGRGSRIDHDDEPFG